MFILERIVPIRQAFLVHLEVVPQFPPFKGWGNLLHRPSLNAHRNVGWEQILLNVHDEVLSPFDEKFLKLIFRTDF